MYFDGGLSQLILIEVSSDSWIFRFMSFTKFEKFLAIITWNTFLSLSLVTFWDSGERKHTAILLTVPLRAHFQRISSCCAAWVSPMNVPSIPWHRLSSPPLLLISFSEYFSFDYCFLFVCLFPYLYFGVFLRLLFLSWDFYFCIKFK